MVQFGWEVETAAVLLDQLLAFVNALLTLLLLAARHLRSGLLSYLHHRDWSLSRFGAGN